MDLRRLRWLGAWGPAAFGALLLWVTLAFHHTLPLWLLVLLVLGIIAAGAALFSWLIFAQIRQREETLTVRVRQQAAVAELGQRALAATDLSTLMNQAVACVAQTLGTEYCKVLELLPDGTALLLRAGVGWKDGSVGHAAVGAGTDSQAGYTLLSSEPVIVEDLRTETRFSGPPLLQDHGVVSGMSVIIHGQDRPFGVLGAHTTRRRTFTTDDSHFLQAIGNLLATAIERKRTEEALREANDTLNAVIQASPMGITILDPDGNVKLWNPAAERIFGWQEEDVLGRPLPSIPPDKRQEHRALRERVLRGEGFSGVDVVRQKKEGSLVDISLSTAPLRDAKGDICGAMGIMADISGRKRAEETLHALYRASLQIQEPLGLQERLARLLQTAQTVLELDRVNILLADPAGEWLQAVASLGVEEPLAAIRVPLGPAGGALAEAYRTQQAVIWDGAGPVPAALR
ncbi:MAG: PAS domain S-box protein, partial [candidate division NC10 bacterium]